jgi:hypothetical protein
MLKHIILSLIFLLSAKPTLALSQFTTDYQISYQVNQSGSTHVKYQINQTNNLSRVYATDFSLSVSHTNIENLKVKDFATSIDPDITLTNNITTINFPFNNKIVGKDKTHQFSLEYDTRDIALQTGSVWEINIPKITTKENINNLTVTLQVPTDFPKLVFVDPKPSKINNNLFTFSSHSLSNKPISALFGSQQFFELNANYYLENKLSTTEELTIAIPPNTSYQEVFIKNLIPQPNNITLDQDGNWLANYILKPKQKLNIKLQQIIKLNFSPKETSFAPSDRYLEETNVWNYNTPEFQKINTNNLKDPQQIFNYVTSSLIYNYSLIKKDPLSREPASFSLEHPTQAICTNFTDLFIALSRKNNLPAREIQGFALSQNDKLKPLSLSQDILHAWPEYFNRTTNTWIQVDPTWTNTTNGVDYFNKLDLNHIAFVIHGGSTTDPLPAGFYKNPAINSKDVIIQEITPQEFPPSNIQINLAQQKGNTLIVNLTNSSGVSLQSNLKISTHNNALTTQPVFLPPFSHQDIEVNLNSRPIVGRSTNIIILELAGTQHTLPVNIKPLFPPQILVIISLVLVILAILIIKKIKKNNSVFPVSIKT